MHMHHWRCYYGVEENVDDYISVKWNRGSTTTAGARELLHQTGCACRPRQLVARDNSRVHCITYRQLGGEATHSAVLVAAALGVVEGPVAKSRIAHLSDLSSARTQITHRERQPRHVHMFVSSGECSTTATSERSVGDRPHVQRLTGSHHRREWAASSARPTGSCH